MAARAIWKGELDLGKVKIKVKLYSAVQERGVHFRLLDAQHKEPVEQRMVHPRSGEAVPSAEVQKGCATDDGSYVLLKQEDLVSIKPEASRDIELSRFVPRGAVPTAFHVRPYYLGPDGDVESYFALARALETEEREGVAHWVMRKRPYDGVLRSADGYLMLLTLRHADEVISAGDLPRPEGRAHTEKELAMAEQLIASYAGDLDLASFKDEYRERVLELVAQKAQGKRVRLKKVETKREEKSLVDALTRSLKQAKKQRRAA